MLQRVKKSLLPYIGVTGLVSLLSYFLIFPSKPSDGTSTIERSHATSTIKPLERWERPHIPKTEPEPLEPDPPPKPPTSRPPPLTPMQRSIDIWGTIDNPKYSIQPSNSSIVAPLEDLVISSVDEDYRMRHHRVNINALFYGIEKHTKTIEKIELKHGSKLDKEKPPWRYRWARSRLKKLQTKLDQQKSWLEYMIKNNEKLSSLGLRWYTRKNSDASWKTEEAKYGDIIDYGNRIFEKLTGNPVPKALKAIFKDKLEGNASGIHHDLSQEIHMTDHSYAGTLETYLHELGHAVYLGHESRFHNVADFDPEFCDMAEEAAGLLFPLAGLQYIDPTHTDLKQDIHFTLTRYRLRWLSPDSSTPMDEHSQGTALATAMLEHFQGDAVKAFNYLLDKNNGSEVNPSIMQRTDEIKSSILSQSDPVGLRAWQTAYKLYNLQKQLDTVMQRIK